MRVELPVDVKNIIETLEANGYEAFAVGGCVRDTLLLRVPGDWDITTSAKPEEVKALFSHTIDTGIQHGTVTVMKNHVGYEVTTYRIDGEYEDARHPKEVIFTANLVEDLKRRDFTINAMAYNDRVGIVDEFQGIQDLEDKVVRCVGNPRERFSEDALRMLRAIRFAAQLGFRIDEETKAAIKELAPTLAKVSKERIAVELVKILVSDHPEEIRTAYELGLTRVFMPEFDVAMETIQHNHHHKYTVGEHSIVAMQHVRPEKMIRLIMLLHDLAKPVVLTTDDKGYDHFVGHTQAGANMAKGILRRLKFDNATIDFVYRMVKHHDDRPPMDNMALVRRRISEIGLENMPMMIEIKRADILAQSDYNFESKMGYVDDLERAYQEVIEKNYCVDKKDLSVNGRDLIAMGMKPGEEIGVVLDLLFDIVINDPRLNEREKLLERANKLITPFIG
ncbi:MAG: CCA tRNA nucleotidyltransferase [Agathobacter sp.]|nr:CCA tRNA nucleotidyltransferase [Agathobacter sp.]